VLFVDGHAFVRSLHVVSRTHHRTAGDVTKKMDQKLTPFGLWVAAPFSAQPTAKPPLTAADPAIESWNYSPAVRVRSSLLDHSICVVNQFSADESFQNFRVPDSGRINGKDVVVDQHHVGELAGSDRSLFVLLEFGIG
jgi:hypothetical protein